MSLEKLKLVSSQVIGRILSVRGRGEEATKQALVLPMLDALGYDIWNPTEVCPEYEADFAVKKAGQKEKVDLAISIGGVPKIYLEVKSIDAALDGCEGQLARYFNSTGTVTLGILTNGIEWRFFTDTGDPNLMDAQPFHVVRLEAADQGLDVMARFAKAVFSPEAIRDYATELKYTANMASFLRDELDLKDRDPSEYLIRWILKSEKMYDGIVNGNVVERFRPIAKAAITRMIRDIVRRSITAMEEEAANSTQVIPDVTGNETESDLNGTEEAIHSENPRQIITTERELRAFEILKSLFDASELRDALIHDGSLKKDVPVALAYKDTTAYFGIYLNKPSCWVVRIVTEAKRPWLGVALDRDYVARNLPEGFSMMEPSAFAESRVAINGPEDLHALAGLFLEAARQMIREKKEGALKGE